MRMVRRLVVIAIVMGYYMALAMARKQCRSHARWLLHYALGSGTPMRLPPSKESEVAEMFEGEDAYDISAVLAKHDGFVVTPSTTDLYRMVGSFTAVVRVDPDDPDYYHVTGLDVYDWHPAGNGEWMGISAAAGAISSHPLFSAVFMAAGRVMVKTFGDKVVRIVPASGEVLLNDSIWEHVGTPFITIIDVRI